MKNKLCLCDCRLQTCCEDTLSSYGIECIRVSPLDTLPSPVASHPDMIILPLGDKLIVSEYYIDRNPQLFSELVVRTGVQIVPAAAIPKAPYPSDIAFNALPMGKYLFGLASRLSSDVISNAEQLGMELISVKQGYSRCSVCKVSDEAAITSDVSLAAALSEKKLDVLVVSEGHILLPGYDYGFIGGASGVTQDNVFFCGNLCLHPDESKIDRFCRKHGKNPVSLSNEPLLDVGTLFFFDC